ncbi:MAG: peptide ABC transporter substrate-binding protein [Anaerolineales bacterium]|nr:peptide ABC transporter substrate-binding protein [Anaerolineales bacterium]MCB0027130.1 peptide ABC transporter substrate-binding protein [Anaerolineales bacterium]
MRSFYRMLLMLLVLLVVVACQDEPAETPEPVEVTRVVTEVVTVPASTVEVTRVVEEVVEVTAAPVQSPTPTSSPINKSLTVCLLREPQSLYPYSSLNFGPAILSAQAVQHGVYENMFTTLDYGYQPRGIVRLPSLDEGDAVIEAVAVTEGDLVINADGQVVTLSPGLTIVNAAGELITYEGGSLNMNQLTANFELEPLVWSDGTPVTADDSVFSFQLAADPITPVDKEPTSRTAVYEATGERTLRWTGLPGWIDPTYFTNIWLPLPRHQLGQLSASEILAADEANRFPLSHGPFVITEWTEGEQITMTANPNYYRQSEGLPRLGEVIFKFVANSEQLLARLLSGQCDIATQDGLDITLAPLLQEAQATGLLQPHFALTPVFEHLDFALAPAPGFAETRPAWFSDLRVRQGIAHCIDRQLMVDAFFYGLSEVAHTIVPSSHPLYPDGITVYDYDVELGNSLMDDANMLDTDGDGIREEPRVRTPLELNLIYASGSEVRNQVLGVLRENLFQCGIAVNLIEMPAPELYDASGPLFGRRFDMAAFPWLSGLTPPCDLYTTAQIPTEATNWQGNNNTGFSNALYDEACQAGEAAIWGSDSYQTNHQAALRILAENLPILPLFPYVNVAASRIGVEGVQLNPTQPSELWNLYELDITAP